MAGLRERDGALAAIGEVLDDARAGGGRAVFFQGEAGLGKTALLDRARLAAGELAVHSARGSAMEAELPLAYAEQLFGLTGEERPPGADPAGEALARRASVHELARVAIRQWARAGPVVVLLDDLHWSDPDSLGVIAFLCRRLSHLPVALIGTLRPWPPGARAAVDALVGEEVAGVVALEPLSTPAAGDLFGQLVGSELSPAVYQQAWDLTRGNPLLLEEAARTYRAEGGLPTAGGGGRESLQRALLLTHLVGLPPAAQEAARAASVLGTRFHPALVEVVAEQRPEEFAQSFDTLVAAGVLREENGWAEFAHDLLGAALYEDMAPAHRRLLHRRAFAGYLARRDPRAATPHALAAGLVGDDQAVAAATEAGELAINEGAVETGVAQLEAAVALAGAEPPPALQVAMGDALFAASRPQEAHDVYQRVLPRVTDRGVQAGIMLKAARAEAYAGRFDRALSTYDQLVSQAGVLGDPETLALVAERAHVVWERDGPGPALEALRATRHLLTDPGPLGPIESYFRLQTGDPAGLAVLDRAAAVARERLMASPTEAMATFNVLPLQASALGHTERPEQALALIEQGCDWLRNAGALRATVPMRNTRIGILINQAKLVEALAEIDDVEEELELDGLLHPHLTAFRAVALAHLGRLEEAEASCDVTDELAGARSFYVILLLGMARGQLHLAHGRAEAASDLFRQVEGRVRAFGIGEPCGPRWAAGAIEAGLAAGRLDDVERVTAWLWEHSAALPCRWPRMVAVAGEAGLLAAGGDDRRAEERYQEALAFPPVGPSDRLAILLRYGSWLRRRNQRLRARPVLADALQLAEAQGAAVAAARARAELAAAGGRRRRRNDDGGLTVQETRVARIALGGATTREIAAELHLSPRTVESHLSSVYRKLGVSSKRDLRTHAAGLEEGS